MTLEQLAVFVAVAEREHVTRAAAAVGLTPSAVSSAIRQLETQHGVQLFERIGRRVELSAAGGAFLAKARDVLASARSASLLLRDLGDGTSGEIAIYASQTIASYWLPPILTRFHADNPGIDMHLTVGNTRTVSRAVLEGRAAVGFVEGGIDEPDLASRPVGDDRLWVVTAPEHPWARAERLEPGELAEGSSWILREAGSGTRSEFEAALVELGVGIASLKVIMTMPSNEAILSAVQSGPFASAVSALAAGPLTRLGVLARCPIELPARGFSMLTHPDRHASRASQLFQRFCAPEALP
ncbi:LysR family transcriptional regulator [Aureimonas flava]|uniref:LysR family transcriptional regulator n=1 Tax=Aureimonas flava TaxID=2320271 RepID=A0A3A1WVN3_9HYPH|nr:LysR family transcriptional regulator [Aureimonas flava]RIY02190.1 LysR family transcriptional regulator [Aureimonas flava]